MTESILALAPVIAAAVLIIVLGLSFTSALAEFISNLRQGRRKYTKPESLTILVNTANTLNIGDCLDSIANAETPCDVVVIDDIQDRAGSAKLARLVKARQRFYRYYKPRKRHDYAKKVRLAYAKSHKSPAVLVIDSATIVTKNGLLAALRNGNTIGAVEPLETKNGFVGILDTLVNSTLHLIGKVYRIVRSPSLRPNESFVIPGAMLKRVDKAELKPVSTPIRLHRSSGATVRLVNYKTTIVLALILTILIWTWYQLVLLAIEGPGLQVFIESWAIMAILAIVIVLFDPLVPIMRKFEVLMTSPFLPIMVILAVFITAWNGFYHRGVTSNHLA